ncbi:MAG: CBS domain-containing protein [Verrucomicrobiota bacterium]
MKVTEIMTRTVEYVTEKDMLNRAAQKMKNINVGAVPVTDDRNQLSGILTDRDIVVRAVAENKDTSITPVSEVMTSGVVSCPVEQTVEEAAKLMEEQQVRRLLVVDGNNNVVGLLSLGDIAVKCPHEELAAEAVEEVSKPAQPAT